MHEKVLPHAGWLDRSNGGDEGANYDSGLDVQYIVFSEPTGARELMDDTCPAQMAQVDYRATYVQYRGIRVSYPRVEVTRYCIQQSR